MASALSQFTRRDFIHQLAFCYAALQLPISFTGCGPKETSFTGKGKPPYKVWEEMLKALENSPDHLSARMKQLIESKDPKAMFDFVREEITLMPSEPNSLRNSGTQLKWGIDGILRYGMATPREKAELLHKMFTEAEIPSRIVFERTNFEPEEVVSFFCKPVERAFDLKIPQRQIKEWQEQLGIETETKGQLQYFDEALEKTHTLAEQLWQVPHAVSLIIFARTAGAQDLTLVTAQTLRLTRLSFLLAVALSVFLMLLAPWLVPLIFGQEFSQSILMLQIIIPGIVFLVIYRVLSGQMAGMGKPQVSIYIFAPALLLNVLLNYLLIPEYGGAGAALASNISYFLGAAGYWFIFARMNGLKYTEILKFRRDDFSPVLQLIKGPMALWKK